LRVCIISNIDLSRLINIFLDQEQVKRVDERAVIDPRTSALSGYGERKWVAEQLLCKAYQEQGINITSVRIGQLSGDTRIGAWMTREWITVLVSLGKTLNALPSRSEVRFNFTTIYATFMHRP
jgi:thioester reductase-like protein